MGIRYQKKLRHTHIYPDIDTLDLKKTQKRYLLHLPYRHLAKSFRLLLRYNLHKFPLADQKITIIGDKIRYRAEPLPSCQSLCDVLARHFSF